MHCPPARRTHSGLHAPRVHAVQEYVAAYLQWLLVDSVATQMNAFARGFNRVAAGPALDLFRAEELSQLVTGSEDLNFEELQGATTYEAPFHAHHASILQFWEVAHALSPEDKKKFLAFVTGCDRAPINGLRDVKMIIQRAGPDSDRLPTASTCFATLLLPGTCRRTLRVRCVCAGDAH